jgi:hypothetical protein
MPNCQNYAQSSKLGRISTRIGSSQGMEDAMIVSHEIVIEMASYFSANFTGKKNSRLSWSIWGK